MMRGDTKCGASERSPFAEALPQATLDARSAHIAVLDEAGGIIAVNRAWRAFAEDNPPLSSNVNEGANYLAVCDAASGPDADVAARVAAGIRAVIRGARRTFEMEYPCHSEDMPLETRDGRHIAVEFVSNVYRVNHQKVSNGNQDVTRMG